MTTFNSIEVYPSFSITDLPESAIGKKLREFLKEKEGKEELEKVLKIGCGVYGPLVVSIVSVPGKLRLMSDTKTIPMEEGYKEMVLYKYHPLDTPYLIGLLQDHEPFLRDQLRDASRIETIVFPSSFTFPGNFMKRPSRLCLRRDGSSIVLDISEYSHRGTLNFGQRYSGTTIKTVILAEEKELFSKTVDKEDLSEKMIS